jgi:hypothetical protein
MSFAPASRDRLTFRDAFRTRWSRYILRRYPDVATAARARGVSPRQVLNWINETSVPAGDVVAAVLRDDPEAAELLLRGD